MEANDRVLTIAEEKFRKDCKLEQQGHNDSVSIAKSVIESNSAKVRNGQWIGFVGALLLFAGGIHLVNLGESLFGVGVSYLKWLHSLVFMLMKLAGVRVARCQQQRAETNHRVIARNLGKTCRL